MLVEYRILLLKLRQDVGWVPCCTHYADVGRCKLVPHQSFDKLVVVFHVFFGILVLFTQINLCFLGRVESKSGLHSAYWLGWSWTLPGRSKAGGIYRGSDVIRQSLLDVVKNVMKVVVLRVLAFSRVFSCCLMLYNTTTKLSKV